MKSFSPFIFALFLSKLILGILPFPFHSLSSQNQALSWRWCRHANGLQGIRNWWRNRKNEEKWIQRPEQVPRSTKQSLGMLLSHQKQIAHRSQLHLELDLESGFWRKSQDWEVFGVGMVPELSRKIGGEWWF